MSQEHIEVDFENGNGLAADIAWITLRSAMVLTLVRLVTRLSMTFIASHQAFQSIFLTGAVFGSTTVLAC